MKGRKLIPIEIKRVQNTLRSYQERQIDPDQRKPYPPSWLNKRAKQIFRHLVKRMDEIGLASRTFTEIIALLASNLQQAEMLEQTLKDDGRYYKSGDLVKEHPGVRSLDRINRHIQSLMAECGLTPSAIQKIGIKSKKKKGSDFDGF